MAASNGFAIRISAVDGATKQIDLINKRLQALQAPVVKMRASMAKLAESSGFNRLALSFKALTAHAMGFARSIASIIPGMSAITGAATLAGMYKLVSHWAEFGTELLHSSTRLGMTVGALHTLQGAARLAGADAGSMTSGLQHLGDTMQDAVAGRAPEAMRLFEAMGIKIHASAFEAKSAAEIMPQLGDKIAGIKHPAIQAQLATQMFGGAAERLLPYLRRGSKGMEEYNREAAKYGIVNEAGAKEAQKFGQAQTKVAMAMEGLGLTIGEKVGPVITPMLEKFASWIALNREWIATGIGGYVKDFAIWVGQIDFSAKLEALKEWGRGINDFVQSMGGWETVTKTLFGLWAVSKVAPIIGAVTSLTTALGGLAVGAAGAGLIRLLTLLGIPAAQIALLKVADSAQGDEPSYDDARASHPTALGRWMYDNSSFLRAQTNRQFGYAAPGVGGMSVPIAPPTGDRLARENAIFDALVARGVDPDEASGITANAMRESGGNPNAHNPAGGGIGAHGLFQWRAERARMANGKLASQGTVDEQVEHFMRERNGSERANINNAVPGASSARQWGLAYSKGFERHGNAEEDAARAAEAERVKQRQITRQLNMTAPPAATPAPTVNPVTAPAQRVGSLNGNANLNIAFANAPAGMTASATADGIFGAPNIQMGMPSYAAA